MRQTLFSLVAAFALCGTAPAQAQDASPAGFDWTGFYLGGTIGSFDGGMDASSFAMDGYEVELVPFALDLDAPAFGVTAGGNIQSGMLVLGIEADYNWLEAEGTEDRSLQPEAIVVSATLQQLATLRARAGLAYENILFYATGGIAAGQAEGHLDDIYRRGTYAYSDTQDFLGWVLGGGVEVAVAEQVSLKAEALYYDLGERTYTFDADPDAPYDQVTARGELAGWTARLGVNFHF